MNKVNLKKALILSCSVLSFSINAQSLGSNEVIAMQCRDLSESIASLISSQAKNTCVDKLNLASLQIEKAGNLILNSAYQTAKEALHNAIFSLQYAELESCNRYIEISHAKMEVQKIKSAL